MTPQNPDRRKSVFVKVPEPSNQHSTIGEAYPMGQANASKDIRRRAEAKKCGNLIFPRTVKLNILAQASARAPTPTKPPIPSRLDNEPPFEGDLKGDEPNAPCYDYDDSTNGDLNPVTPPSYPEDGTSTSPPETPKQ